MPYWGAVLCMVGMILLFFGLGVLCFWGASGTGEAMKSYKDLRQQEAEREGGCLLIFLGMFFLYVAMYMSVIFVRALSGDVI